MRCGDGDPRLARLAVGDLGVVVVGLRLATGLRLAVALAALRLAGGAVIGGAHGAQKLLHIDPETRPPPATPGAIGLVADGVHGLAKHLDHVTDVLPALADLVVDAIALVVTVIVLGEVLHPLLESLAGADLALSELLQRGTGHLVGQGGHPVRTDGVLAIHPPNHLHFAVPLAQGELRRPEVLGEPPVQQNLHDHLHGPVIPPHAVVVIVAELLDHLLVLEQGLEDLGGDLVKDIHPRIGVRHGGDDRDGLFLILGVVEAEHQPGLLLEVHEAPIGNPALDEGGENDRQGFGQFFSVTLHEDDAPPHTFLKFPHVHHVSPGYRPKTVAVLVVSTPNIRGSFDIIW